MGTRNGTPQSETPVAGRGSRDRVAEVMPVSVDTSRLKLISAEGDEGVLVGMRCRDCDARVFGAASFCQSCTSANLEPAELSRRGTLYSYTIVRVPPAGWPGPVPYVLGQVELPEGPHVLAEVIECEHADLRIGMGLELALQQVPPQNEPSGSNPEAVVVYKFRPEQSG